MPWTPPPRREARRARSAALALVAAVLLAPGAAFAQEREPTGPGAEAPAAEPAADATAAAEEGAPSGANAPAPLRVELNKLEEREGTCRVYLVLENANGPALETLRLDLVLFDPEGVILRRLAVDAGPLAPERTRVRLFDVEELACERVGRLLLNGVLACEDAAGEPAVCADRLELGSRADVPFDR